MKLLLSQQSSIVIISSNLFRDIALEMNSFLTFVLFSQYIFPRGSTLLPDCIKIPRKKTHLKLINVKEMSSFYPTSIKLSYFYKIFYHLTMKKNPISQRETYNLKNSVFSSRFKKNFVNKSLFSKWFVVIAQAIDRHLISWFHHSCIAGCM